MNALVQRFRPITFLVLGFAALMAVAPAVAAPWHHPLYLDGGDCWRARIKLVVHNRKDLDVAGEPVAVRIGTAPGEADLAGAAAEAIRLVDAQGTEMLFALSGPAGERITAGPIPAGGTLVIPAECPARATADYYVYFDNPAAGQVPDFLSARLELVNGDVEAGDGPAPAGWRHDRPDATHRASWSTESAQSGRRCLKTVVDPGAEPTWIATRQHNVHVLGGMKYVMRAWVKAEDVKGSAGWYIHVGNRQQPMIISPMLSGGDGTFDWKPVTAEFTAPAGADRADLGTVLRGTGTAWFDNVSLECEGTAALHALAEPPERIDFNEVGRLAAWYQGEPGDSFTRDCRAVVKVFNFSPQPTAGGNVSVDIARLNARMRGKLNRESIVVTSDGQPVPHQLFGDMLLFAGDVPATTVQTFYIYFSADPQGEPSTDQERAMPAAGSPNLVKNPGFEAGDALPEAWTTSGPQQGADGVAFGLDAPGRRELGSRCARMHVPPGLPEVWRGWHQAVAVEPGKTYLLAARMKCRAVVGDVCVHAHKHDAAGRLSNQGPMVSIGPAISGTRDWTVMSGVFTMPEDTVSFRLHLTMNTSGTVWHDGVLLSEILPGRIARIEGRTSPETAGVSVWQVPAVVKVFRDDPAPQDVPPAAVSLARNEKEPLQLAIRSGRAHAGVRIEVDPPENEQGTTLDAVEVNLVGYVPIDHATSYYRAVTPAWHRKYPTAAARCDGWPGPWPDPLLPQTTFDLAAGATQPIWITVGAGKEAPAGDYTGRVRLVSGDETLAEVPFRVHCWDFTVPDENHVAAIYDVRLGHGSALWGKPLDEMYPEIVRFMAQRRLCPDTIRPTPVFKLKDGRPVADFAEFDRAAAWYFHELKLPFAYTPWNFYLFGWGHPPKTIFGQRPYPGDPPYDGVDRARLRPEYKAMYQACLKLYWDHLKQKGWDKKVVLYISDEPFDQHEHIRTQMKALCDMIHEVDPAIPIYSSTWKHVPEWDGYLDVWGIGHYGRVPVEKMAELRAAGDRIWFTTDGQMCTDTPYCAVERLLPHYCFQVGAEAYEFWGVAWLTYNPYRYGWHAYIHQTSEPGNSFWVRYPNGDGFLLYPGAPIGHDGLVSSIRLEQAREGVEDYEYLHLLRGLIRQAQSAGRDTTAAEAAMQQAAALITIPNTGGRYSSKILPEPGAVYEVRKAVASAVEQLSR